MNVDALDETYNVAFMKLPKDFKLFESNMLDNYTNSAVEKAALLLYND